jgi:hypothetical protein
MKPLLPLLFLILILSSCSVFKPNRFYDEQADDAEKPNIGGFEALSIYSDQLSSENWHTQEPAALKVKAETEQVFSGNQSISIEWNKQATTVNWLGMGFGWLNWSGKNFESILDKAALSFRVKSKKGALNGLPWAVGFEDFSGTQAWSGVTTNFVKEGSIRDDAWSDVVIPLSNFPFEARGVEVSSIKQLIVQFESSGKVWIDDVKLVPYTAKGRSKLELVASPAPVIDGNIAKNEWAGNVVEFPKGRIYLHWDNQNLYAALIADDETPSINTQVGKDIWNGDALEIAFSSLANSNPKRTFLFPEDCHIGISMGEPAIVYNWAKDAILEGVILKKTQTGKSYICEVAIPWAAIGVKPLNTDVEYDFEIALDMSDASGKRGVQYRWNSNEKEGFHQNPSLWGSIIQRGNHHE